MWATKSNHKDAEHLELSLTKPTDQMFHQLNNVRFAERLLFTRYTRDPRGRSQVPPKSNSTKSRESIR